MQTRLETKSQLPTEAGENLKPIDIDNLRFLIHAYDAKFGEDLLWTNQVFRVRADFQNKVLKYFLPSSPKDLLLFIPNAGPKPEDLGKYVMATWRQVDLFTQNGRVPLSWISLLNRCKSETAYPENIFVEENIALPSVTSRRIERRLLEKRFRITSSTNVIVGGEYTDKCVVGAVVDLLSLPQINEVLLDTRVILGPTEYVKQNYAPAGSLEAFGETMIDLGHSVTPQRGSPYISVTNL
ncbi:MAG: hypothetical protein Q8Q49_02235 [bacterium]|nr:hypothetical protein [bacterium]